MNENCLCSCASNLNLTEKSLKFDSFRHPYITIRPSKRRWIHYTVKIGFTDISMWLHLMSLQDNVCKVIVARRLIVDSEKIKEEDMTFRLIRCSSTSHL